MAHQQGPIDIVAVNDDGDTFFVDVKTEGKRISKLGTKPTRIHRVRTAKQKNLNVMIAYVGKRNIVQFVPDLINHDLK